MSQENNPLYVPRQENEADVLAEIRSEFEKNDLPFTWFELQEEMKDGLTDTANQLLQMHTFKRALLVLVLKGDPDDTRAMRASIMERSDVATFLEQLKTIYLPYLKADTLKDATAVAAVV